MMTRIIALSIATLLSLSAIAVSAESVTLAKTAQQEGNYTPIQQQPPLYLRLAQNATRECPVDKNGKPYCGNNCPLCK